MRPEPGVVLERTFCAFSALLVVIAISGEWMSVTYRDRHAGQLKANTPVDQADIDWAKSHMADLR
jgi:hypothetical protein